MSNLLGRSNDYRPSLSLDEAAISALTDFGLFNYDWSECARNGQTLVVRVEARKTLVVERNDRLGHIRARVITARPSRWAAKRRIPLVSGGNC